MTKDTSPPLTPMTTASTGGDWRRFDPIELPPILAAAKQHIVRHGYDATSVRTIAREVGVTVPALYYHYENKQAMLVALLDQGMGIVIDHVERALATVGDDPAERLSVAVEAIVLYMAHHRDIAFLDSERRSLTEENLARYVAQRDVVESQVHQCIEDGCAAGLFATPAPRNTARGILSMTQGVAGWFSPAGPQTAEETAREFVHIALAAVEYRGL